jgi:ABC-2 type transport system ATP-binding protein
MSSAHVVASSLGKCFSDRRVLDNLTFAVEPGDVVGVLGKNGAGKTTLLETMLGFSAASAGTVRLFGHDSFRMPAEVKARIGFVPQQDELLTALTGADQIKLVASFYRGWDAALVERLCNDWGMNLAARIATMSVGERQKLSILLALGHRPDLLILDEPVASLDPVARRQFLEQIVEIAADGQRSVVFSSHIVSDIERLANRIWILKAGRLYWQGDLDSLKESIVRVHLRGARGMPENLQIPGALSVRRADSGHLIAVAQDWSDRAALELERHAGVAPEVETLQLEEIFLELHR